VPSSRSLDLRRRQVNVAVVFATALTCYLFYLHIENSEPYSKQYDLINLILNFFVNLFMLSYDKNCIFHHKVSGIFIYIIVYGKNKEHT
jgi:hypothetical protein